ncbi:MAG: PD-(D/E)XK nuclease family protein [Betaproteobacteria bacterium]|nr:PD-(D/E)XK nuclease family protein [Betaproteobacteria bacterium]
MPATPIDKTELFARLAEGGDARITVVTPNTRLAQELARDFDRGQAAKGLNVWETADILPFSAFCQRAYEDALYSESASGPPQLLTGAQEREIWESVLLRGSELLVVSQAAAQCADAWRLAHAWRIDAVLGKFQGNEDAQAFAAWAREYARRCASGNFIDVARLPDLAAKVLEKRPKLLVAYAFDLMSPQTSELFGTLEREGVEFRVCRAVERGSKLTRASFPSARHELEAAAAWARARLEAGATRIGVVFPGLQQQRREVVRVFSRVMRPDHQLSGAKPTALPFNVSLGEPLVAVPLVSAALGIVAFSFQEIAFEQASGLIRSPFIGGAQAEMADRALLDARLRGRLSARVTLPKLIAEVKGCPVLRSCLEKVFSLDRSTAKRNESPHFWAQHFSALLDAAGFPGERTIDSGEYQARARFNEALTELSRLGVVAGKISIFDAMMRIRRLCTETLFQPETPEAPIQVLGILESAGLEFDHLWVCGLSDEAWPLAARPNPFLPIALQKQAGIPEAAAETSLALDRRITEGWIGAAGEVVFSWPQKEQDRNLMPSPLITHIAEGTVDAPVYPRFRDLLFAARRLEQVPDGEGPPLAQTSVRGGTRVLADQAACPFRAFARHRLGARALEEPAPGPDAMARGTLLHDLMANLWRELKDSAALAGDVASAIERAATGAVADAGLEGRFAELERARLAKLAREWLDLERGREPFAVAAIEEPRGLAIGGLEMSGRIDRLDRLADGSHALIDYKTGRVTRADWMGARPQDPQLPLYAVTAKEEIGAVVFAKLKTGEMKFTGYGLDKGLVEAAKDWDALRAGWKSELESLARSFASGNARVDPKKQLQTCRLCDLQTLCRVHEKLALLDDESEGGEAYA